MQYTYVLLSEADGKFYTGATSDLRKRLRLHAAGRVASTVSRRPLRLTRARLASSLADIRANKLERH